MPLKNEAEKFRKENNELHFQLIKIKEEIDLKDTKWKITFKSLEDEISDVKFTLDLKEKDLNKRNLEVRIFPLKFYHKILIKKLCIYLTSGIFL